MTSRQEQEWLKKFYEGTFLVKGWRAQTKSLLKDFHGDEREALSVRLSDLGEKIGREWARDNAVRRIDTAQLRQWGDSLTGARREGPDVLISEIRSIAAEVDDLLS
jgi:hypothetical protein